jgi:serine/threonine protein kinase
LKEIGPLNEPKKAFVCKETLTAIEFIHLNKLIHRDIKAADMLMTEKGEIKLTDLVFLLTGKKTRYLLWNALMVNLFIYFNINIEPFGSLRMAGVSE